MPIQHPILQLKQVSKTFQIYATPADRLKERLFGVHRHREHKAIDCVSLTLMPGQAMAIIGRNGAGKSTLLKLITGVLMPDAGCIQRHGRITGLLELGTGFDPNLTGRDNIVINGQLIGMSLDEIHQQSQAIVDFAELGEYIDAPVKTYSSGMLMRLGFAIAIHANPACFVVDEALAVGDARFQQKCLQRIRQFRQQGGALLFVSHDLAAVKQLCDQSVVLHQGQLAFEGETLEAVNVYNRLLADLDQCHSLLLGEGYGHRHLTITSVSLTGEQGQQDDFATGESVTLRVTVRATKTMQDMTIGFLFRDRFGHDAFGTNTHLLGFSLSQEAATQQTYQFTLPLNLGHGKYTLTVALHSGSNHHDDCQHWWDDAMTFRITGNQHEPFSGYCYLPTHFDYPAESS